MYVGWVRVADWYRMIYIARMLWFRISYCILSQRISLTVIKSTGLITRQFVAFKRLNYFHIKDRIVTDTIRVNDIMLSQRRRENWEVADYIQYTIYNIQYTIYNIQYIQYTIYNIQYTIYNIQYTIHNIQYTIYTIYNIYIYIYIDIYIYIYSYSILISSMVNIKINFVKILNSKLFIIVVIFYLIMSVSRRISCFSCCDSNYQRVFELKNSFFPRWLD